MTLKEQIEHWKTLYTEMSDYCYEGLDALHQVIKDISQELQEKTKHLTILEQTRTSELLIIKDIEDITSKIDNIKSLVLDKKWENRQKRASATNTNSDAIKRTQ